MTTDTRTYRIAPKFYDDHVERDLVEGYAKVLRETRTFVEVEMDRDAYDALLADADYYAAYMRDPEDVDAYTIALSRSAERVAAKLRAAGAPDPVPDDVAQRRQDEREARIQRDRAAAAEYTAKVQARIEREKAEKARRKAIEDAIDIRVLIGIENSGKGRDGISPADASRILDDRAATTEGGKS